MTKKVLAGFLVGGAAAFGAWQALSADKKKQIKQAVADKTHDAVDYATDYAINALDLADGMVQDVKEQAVDKFGDKFSDLAGSVKKRTLIRLKKVLIKRSIILPTMILTNRPLRLEKNLPKPNPTPQAKMTS